MMNCYLGIVNLSRLLKGSINGTNILYPVPEVIKVSESAK